MRWQVHGERTIYDSEWVRLTLADVEIPGGERFEHHVVRMPNNAAGTVVLDPERGVLLLWRHRFITDTWGWEIPAGDTYMLTFKNVLRSSERIAWNTTCWIFRCSLKYL